MKILLLISILTLGAFSVVAQSPTPEKCPSIEVTGPSTISSPGDTIEFRAGVTNYAHPEKLSYKWTVSLGDIVKGQGTSTIRVKKPEDRAGSNVTATVEISGLPAGCENRASETEPIDDRSTTQALAPDKCPSSLWVVGPAGIALEGEPIQFTAGVKDYSTPEKLTYNWSVSSGTIVGGQGTSTIKIEPPKANDVLNITATVVISGLPDSCVNTGSETYSVIICVLPRTVDEFGRIPLRSDMKARIDNFFIEFNEAPGNIGLISIRLDKNESARRRLAYVNQLYSLAAELRPGLKDVYFTVEDDPTDTSTRLLILPVVWNLDGKDPHSPIPIPGNEFKSHIPKLLAPRSKK